MLLGTAADYGLRLLERLERPSTRVLTVLTYHRVDADCAHPELDPRLISATPAEFERQVVWLACNASPISLWDLLDVRRGRAELPPRAVLVTFDDAYRDFASNAWPVLRRHRVPVTLFVPTSFPGQPERRFWWDRLHAALSGSERVEPINTPAGRMDIATLEARRRTHRALCRWVEGTPHDDATRALDEICGLLGEPRSACPVLDWHELRELAAAGVALAPHSRTHPRLDQLPDERLRDEVAGSRADIEREIGPGCPPAFAFPGGGCDERLEQLLADEGFELGFTTRRGPNDLTRADWLRLRRSNVGRRTSLPVLRIQLISRPAWAARALAEAAA